ncbi:hypothetical protein TNCV_3357121 [Trichonephila clavipes]|nr:hypothetical protein TNCV_3357121 [Trichonephila clavipes]
MLRLVFESDPHVCRVRRPVPGKVESGVPVACPFGPCFSVDGEAGIPLTIPVVYICSESAADISTEEILENLQDQKVCGVKRITIRRNGQVLDTKHLILTFATPDLPQSVKWHTYDALSVHISPIRSDVFNASVLDILN